MGGWGPRDFWGRESALRDTAVLGALGYHLWRPPERARPRVSPTQIRRRGMMPQFTFVSCNASTLGGRGWDAPARGTQEGSPAGNPLPISTRAHTLCPAHGSDAQADGGGCQGTPTGGGLLDPSAPLPGAPPAAAVGTRPVRAFPVPYSHRTDGEVAEGSGIAWGPLLWGGGAP